MEFVKKNHSINALQVLIFMIVFSEQLETN